jgi:hypothetical protein
MNASYLSGLAGILLAVLFRYFPGLNTKYAALSNEYQQLIMIVLVVAAAVLTNYVSCYTKVVIPFIVKVECTPDANNQIIQSLIMALVGNQSTAMIAPKSAAVKAADATPHPAAVVPVVAPPAVEPTKPA